MSPSGRGFWLALLDLMEHGYAPFRDTENLLVLGADIIQAYFDESGNNPGARYFLLAGFISGPERWGRFDEEWRSALADLRPPLPGAFSATSFFKRSPLSENRQECLRRLLLAVQRHRLYPLGAILDIDSFNSLTYGERRYLSGAAVGADETGRIHPKLLKPYYFLFHHCIANAAKQTKPGKTVQIVFERQAEYSPHALALFNVIIEALPVRIRPRVGACTFACREKVGPPLEVADLLAHCWYAHMQYAGKSREREQTLHQLMSMKNWLHRYKAKDLEIFLNQLPPEERARLREEAEPDRPLSPTPKRSRRHRGGQEI